MRTFILILALSAIVMTRFLSNDDTLVFENPWTGDQANGKCERREHLDIMTDANGTFAQCMPIISKYNYEKACPKPPKFETERLSAFRVPYSDDVVPIFGCVVECSDAPNACPKDSQCMNAPKHFQTDFIKQIC